MQKPIHPSFGWVKPRCGQVEILVVEEKMKEQKRFSKIIDIVSYALKMGVT